MERLFSTIPTVISATANDDATAEALIFAAWRHVAGEALNQRTLALRFEGRKLTVAVRDALWQRNLEDLAAGFIARLNRIAGDKKVTFIEFVVEPAALDRGGKAEKPEADFHLEPSLISAADAIADEDLRKNFLAAARDYLARQTAG